MGSSVALITPTVVTNMPSSGGSDIHEGYPYNGWYLPIVMEDEGVEGIILKYAYYFHISAILDVPHFHQNTLKKSTPKTKELIESGIIKYRDARIPEVVHKDLVTGKCERIIIDYGLEGFYDIDWKFIATIMGVKEEKLIWISSIYNPVFLNSESNVRVEFDNFWEKYLVDQIRDHQSDNIYSGIKQQIKDIRDLKIRPYHGLSYNRRPHIHRAYLLAKMRKNKLLDRTAWSWRGAKNPSDYAIRNAIQADEDFLQGLNSGALTEEDRDSFVSIMQGPRRNFPGEDLSTNKAHSINFDHISSTYFQIINETFVQNNSRDPFLSEKSYKPFASGQPFVMWGQQNTVWALREQGYYTFEDWIDHHYDSIADPIERMAALVIEIERLYAKTPQEWSLMLLEMLPNIEKNFNFLLSAKERQFTLSPDDINKHNNSSRVKRHPSPPICQIVDKPRVSPDASKF
tara:strand:- start:1386 stop:2759 length:1374 start_codon:yes stop_codon:yes gene_type:complete